MQEGLQSGNAVGSCGQSPGLTLGPLSGQRAWGLFNMMNVVTGEGYLPAS